MTIGVLDGTGASQTIQTIDDLAKNAGATTSTTARTATATDSPEVVAIGAKTNAKSTATNATALSLISISKQLSACLQLVNTALGATAITFGAGAADARTMRVTIDSGQLGGDPTLTDSSAFPVTTGKVVATGYMVDDVSTNTVAEGSAGVARMTADRKPYAVAEVESSSMRIAGVAVTPKFAPIAASASGNNTVVAAVASKKIRVLAANIMSSGVVNSKWQSGAAGTDISGLTYMIANTGIVLPFNPAGWFETAVNTLLNLNLSAATPVGGGITYIEV